MKRVLLIDDSEAFRVLAAQLLSIQWPDVEVEEYDPVTRGAIAPDFDLWRYDVVLLDQEWGIEQNGLDWLAQIAQRGRCPPIVLLTADGSEELAARSIKLGAAEYLSKVNVTRQTLIEAVGRALEKWEQIAGYATADGGRDTTFGAAAATTTIENSAQRPVISGYRLGEKIGEGGMARVFLAQRLSDDLQVVLKILDTAPTATDLFLERFEREFAIVANINSSYVVKIYEQGFTDRHVFIAMEYFARGDLAARVSKTPDIPAMLRIFYHLIKALCVIHHVGVVHRDLKPQNVMFRADGSLALVDFGIAKSVREHLALTTHGQILGTPYYMSPEQVRGELIDARSDLYTAGVILYELLTGNKPYRGRSAMEIAEKHDRAPVPPLPPALAQYQDLLDQLMAKQAQQRLQSADDVLLKLARLHEAGVDSTPTRGLVSGRA